MKKILAISMAIALTASVFAGCSSSGTNAPAATATPSASAPAASAPAVETNIAKVGIGHITSIAKSKDLGTDKDGKEILPAAQVDTVIVAAGFDKDGKVASVTIDNAQTVVGFNKDLSLKSDVKAELKTKVELKDEYGMIKGSSIKKEWYQQAESLGNWMVGKTIDQIKGMKTVARDETHPAVPDEADLKSSVTISVQDYIAAVEEAFKNSVDANGATKVGLGHNISIAKSKGLGKDKDGKEVLPLAQVDTVMTATAFDKDGKVVTALIDNAQTKVQFDNAGKVTSDKKAEYKTKVELKDEYGMIKASSIKKEWYQQADALGKWMAGKTVDQIKGMKTVNKDESHPAVPDEADLKSSVTISVQDYIAAVEEAFKNAK